MRRCAASTDLARRPTRYGESRGVRIRYGPDLGGHRGSLDLKDYMTAVPGGRATERIYLCVTRPGSLLKADVGGSPPAGCRVRCDAADSGGTRPPAPVARTRCGSFPRASRQGGFEGPFQEPTDPSAGFQAAAHLHLDAFQTSGPMATSTSGKLPGSGTVEVPDDVFPKNCASSMKR